LTSRIHDGPLGDDLTRRAHDASSLARRLLPSDEESRLPADQVEDVAALIARLEQQLAVDAADQSGWQRAAAAHGEECKRLERRFHVRFDALEGVDRAIAQLRQITSPNEILKGAPEALCGVSDCTRVVLSIIRDGYIIAFAAHFSADRTEAAKVVEQLAAMPIRLEHPLIEADLVRRRRATIVADVAVHPRVHRPTAHLMRWHCYIAAPLVVGEDVIGVIHADTGPGGRNLDVLDGDVVWAFARGLAGVYETASLRRALRLQRDEMTAFSEWLSARARELSESAVELVRERPTTPEPPGQADLVGAAPTIADRIAFANLLTRRELDVLRLLASGETNGAIADKLVVSEATVKFHVVNLLRKLRVSNRAEAVARYHRVLRARSHDSA
jgi:DNA-binding CsgD family transcriptional regulator